VTIKAVAFCALVLAATPAAAQTVIYGPYGATRYAYETRYAYAYGAISPEGIQARLRAHGLRPVTQPVLTGRYVVVRAVDRYGDVVRVLLNAQYGNIVSIAPLPPAPVVGERFHRPYYRPYPSRAYEPYPRYGVVPPEAVPPVAMRPDLKSEPAEALPNAQHPVPPAQEYRAAAVTPAVPMPRPRPVIPPTAVAAKPAPAAVQAPHATPVPEPAPAVAQAPRATPVPEPAPAVAQAPRAAPAPDPDVTGSVAPRKALEFPPAASLE
jgi:hypothetical protein